MKVIVYFMVAIGLIWVGVLESASSSVQDFKQGSNREATLVQRSVQRVLAVGLVGDLVVSKIISDGRQTVILKGNEKFFAPNEALSESAGD